MNWLARLGGSLKLALEIVKGSARLLRAQPKLILPLLPVFLMLLVADMGLLVTPSLVLSLFIIFIVAFELMFSFVITSQLLRQIHAGEKPSLRQAISSGQTLRLLPRVFSLALIWFTLILILVVVEFALNALLNRDGGDGGIVASIFGTLADALRMMGFMAIPIMVFEEIGLREAFGRLRSILADNPITALGGLALTKLITAILFFGLQLIAEVNQNDSPAILFLTLAAAGAGWMLAMYLEQLFVTGLYLYSAYPESPIVGILLQQHLGKELPQPAPPDLSAQPTPP